MLNTYLYNFDFPQEFKINESNAIQFFHQQDWVSLNDIVVCRDKYGNITARFGQSQWDLMPFARHKNKNFINFEIFDDSPVLQAELKLLILGWILHKSFKGTAPKYTTIVSRYSRLKLIYSFLKAKNKKSLSALSNQKIFEEFKAEIQKQNYSQSTVEEIFVTLNKVRELEPWLELSFGFAEKLNTKSLAKNLSHKVAQQTLVIPERLSDAIYGKAIELIEDAHPYRHLIAETEAKLQRNYLDGQRILDEKIKNGALLTCSDGKGNITNFRKYTTAIGDNFPRNPAEIVKEIEFKPLSVELNHTIDFTRYLGQLITACYIACGAFSGMRDSELEKLTPDSYFKDTWNGRTFHMLQSYTFKLGEKRETWVVAPVVEKAIELASALTKAWRDQITYPNEKYTNTLWCNQLYRSRIPVLISKWSDRLKYFCEQFSLVVTEQDLQECIESNPNSFERITKSVIVGKPWPLTSHQFRRSLAFYTIKHRLGTKVALKQQFKHLYLSMTEWYTNGGKLASIRDLSVDKEVQKALNLANTEMITSKIFNQWHSNEPLSGAMGRAIVKMRDDIPHIYSSWDNIFNAVKNGTLTLHGTAHSYCKNGYDCDMDGVVMPQFCVDCAGQGSIIEKEQALWWQKKHNSLVKYLKLGEEISVVDKAHYITQIRAAENVMRDFEMDFIPFEPELKVTEL